MDAKKSKRVDLREKRGLFFQIGMVVALTLIFTAFQWTSTDSMDTWDLNTDLGYEIDEAWLPVRTKQQRLEPPKPKAVEILTIIDDQSEDIPDIIIEDTEGNIETAIEIIEMPPEVIDDEEPVTFWIVEDMPLYPGGDSKLMKDIMSRVVYPEESKENGVQGRVFVNFIVNKKGNVENVNIVRGVDELLNNEAMRVIKTLSGWTPGMQRKKAVNVAFTVPIYFRLN